MLVNHSAAYFYILTKQKKDMTLETSAAEGKLKKLLLVCVVYQESPSTENVYCFFRHK